MINPEIDKYGNKIWYNSQGQFHRDDGCPAAEYASGHKEWYINGKLHREDGPASEWSDGTLSWFIDGKRII